MSVDKKPKPFESPQAFVQGMLGSLQRNARGYAQTVGELNAILWFVHGLWAGISNREREFGEVRHELYTQEFAERVEAIRLQPISDLESQRVVLELWQGIDRALNIDTDPDQYELSYQ